MATLSASLRHCGDVASCTTAFFDTVLAQVPGRGSRASLPQPRQRGINLRLVDADHVGIACDETTTDAHVAAVLEAFGVDRLSSREPATGVRLERAPPSSSPTPRSTGTAPRPRCCATCARSSDKDIALDRSMIPLGSCTMKLNAAAEMEPSPGPISPTAPVRADVGRPRACER